MTILNTIAYRHLRGPSFRWTPYKVKTSPDPADVRDMSSNLAFERGHDTLSLVGHGSDSHGWRNAINYYGWGSTIMRDRAERIYETLAYGTYDAAVRAIARFGMPIGIVGWAGGYAQVMTGCIVVGSNPATSDAFTVHYVHLTDPLKLQGHVDYRVSNTTFKSGA